MWGLKVFSELILYKIFLHHPHAALCKLLCMLMCLMLMIRNFSAQQKNFCNNFTPPSKLIKFTFFFHCYCLDSYPGKLGETTDFIINVKGFSSFLLYCCCTLSWKTGERIIKEIPDPNNQKWFFFIHVNYYISRVYANCFKAGNRLLSPCGRKSANIWNSLFYFIFYLLLTMQRK